MRHISRPALAMALSLASIIVATGQRVDPSIATHLLAQAAPPVYVTLWFDTEDYILPQDDDATKRLAMLLSDLGVRATFKVVGEKARVLEQRGRTDVIAALKRHDIGYHSNTHSQQPTVAVYLQHAGWDEGRAEYYRREIQGVRDVERIFGRKPVAYGQPGSAWAPQTYPALHDMGIGMYLDEADHVGIDDQPFYYGGMLNVFKMRSNLARMNLTGGASLDEGKARFTKAYDALRAKGGGTISIYYHPNEWVHSQFWDAVNFSRGANPPRDQWKTPGTRPAAETEQAFKDFEQYVRFIKALAGVRFVTATELMTIYQDRSMTRPFGRDDLVAFARSIEGEISFQRRDAYALSAADVFALLTSATAEFIEKGELPRESRVALLYGPSRIYSPATGSTESQSFPWAAFANAVRDTADFCKTRGRVPDEIWIGSESLSPADYLATLAHAFEDVSAAGRAPAVVARRTGRFTADRFVADDSPALWGWVIFPEGFHAPSIMELARLQAWTLKPALLPR
jgi:peptidoglycan/xylan/chitin deacetylase (PgdA/CDA1 family)